MQAIFIKYGKKKILRIQLSRNTEKRCEIQIFSEYPHSKAVIPGWANSNSIILEVVKNASVQVPPQPTTKKPEILGMGFSGVVTNCSGGFWCTLKYENRTLSKGNSKKSTYKA